MAAMEAMIVTLQAQVQGRLDPDASVVTGHLSAMEVVHRVCGREPVPRVCGPRRYGVAGVSMKRRGLNEIGFEPPWRKPPSKAAVPPPSMG